MSLILRWFLIVIFVFFRPHCRTTTFALRGPATLLPPPSQKDNDCLPRRGEQCTSPRGHPEIEPGFDHSQSTWRPSRCISIPVNFTFCRGAGYSQMHLPNLLQHENLSQAMEQAASWVSLFDARCHPDIKIFLCSLLAPICHVRPIWPCRKLCQSVRGRCESVMLGSGGFQWPEDLACDRLPSDSRNAFCISDQKHQRSKGRLIDHRWPFLAKQE